MSYTRHDMNAYRLKTRKKKCVYKILLFIITTELEPFFVVRCGYEVPPNIQRHNQQSAEIGGRRSLVGRVFVFVSQVSHHDLQRNMKKISSVI